jgi:non-specific serine/threonine protein kinase/serine/threonine-protein kinase
VIVSPGPVPDPTRSIHAPSGAPGDTIGPYQLLRQIGEGGMGIVYHAQQTHPLRRDVALKIIKPGMDSKLVIARFETERQTLAVLDHPNIAHVLDAGATASGLPYFVMELVEGVPITEYCDTKRLTVKERIELFITVCEAIQHAHQKGIIHRDLKPSNIMVAEYEGNPTAKVIDFGLAKALGRQLTADTAMTSLGTVVGTLEYMSPEQAEMTRQDVETRSDIYSLGVVFYELLTGDTPLEHERTETGGYLEVLKRIREEEPAAPSTRLRNSTASAEVAAQRQSDPGRLPKLLRGELDWIAMRALEKDRSRRYQTVNGFARDLERYLACEPVQAVPQSARYRLGKFARKHRAGLAVAAGFAMLLIAGVVVSASMAIRARRAEQEAQAVNDFLRNDLLLQAAARTQAQPAARPDPHIEVRTALDRASVHIEGKFPNQPLVEAAIRQTLSYTYMDLGRYADAQRHAARALELRRRVLGERNKETLDSMFSLAIAYDAQDNLPPAEALLVKLVDARKSVLGKEHPDTLRAMARLGEVYTFEGQEARAEELLKSASQVQSRTLGAEHNDTLTTLFGLGTVYYHEARYAEAVALLDHLWTVRRRLLGEEHPDTLTTANNLANGYFRQNQFAQAGAIYQSLLDINRRVSGEEHPRTLNSMTNLANALQMQGKYQQAEPLFVKALDAQRRLRGDSAPATLTVMGDLGELYRDEGAYAQAERLLVPALAALRRVTGDQHRNTAAAMQRVGLLYRDQGKFAQADALLAESLAVRRRALGPEHPDTLEVQVDLAETKVLQQHDVEAEELLTGALKPIEKASPNGWARYYCQNVLGASLAGQKKYVEAEPLLLSGYDGILQRKSSLSAPEMGRLRRAGERIVRLYQDWGKPAKAAEWRAKLRSAG